MRTTDTFEVRSTPDEVVSCVAEWVIGRVAATQGPFRIALSGGTTPKSLFTLLAAPNLAARIDWSRLHLFWGDERYVPYESPDSNYGEARRLFLNHVAIPAAQVHPMPVDAHPDLAAASYEQTLKSEYGQTGLDPLRPLFDINLLGLGADGHTASLIPGQPVLQERDRWVSAVGQGRPEVRLTLTYPALESARVVAFLITGAAKAGIVANLRDGTADVPAAHLQPRGEAIWFLDRAAAGTL